MCPEQMIIVKGYMLQLVQHIKHYDKVTKKSLMRCRMAQQITNIQTTWVSMYAKDIIDMTPFQESGNELSIHYHPYGEEL